MKQLMDPVEVWLGGGFIFILWATFGVAHDPPRLLQQGHGSVGEGTWATPATALGVLVSDQERRLGRQST